MEILKWREIYATGVEEMDNQHKQLIKLVNSMYLVVRDQQELEDLDGVLEEMGNYAESHFNDEEQLLEQHGYDQLEQHKKSHGAYREKMAEMSLELEKDRTVAAKNIYGFLRTWWVDHIVDEDKKYGPTILEKMG